MNKDSVYYRQVALLLKMLPIIANEKMFALKGGTAINLFVRDFPRLSVDIDLSYLPLEPREEAIANVRTALQRIVEQANSLQGLQAHLQDNNGDELRIIVTTGVATIKIELSPVARGTLHDPEVLPVVEDVETEFGYAEIAVVSMPDLYGGKLCAAMDRQHPRDLFDVRMLLATEEGITREIFVGFLAYTLSHPRPISEVMDPRWKDLSDAFQQEFEGMTNAPVTLEELLEVPEAMFAALKAQFIQRDRDFLLSFKRGEPDWTLFDVPTAEQLPAIRWKLQNLQKLRDKNPEKHQKALLKLDKVLTEPVNPIV
ncbi:nucleotidyl transferase AbiEii/AbiGii toxin family protein [Aeromonas salmonicida]|uniref:nucleotidyl transferase AbiEii/AbiGii toxin family protein n=1 Tax=Aeromonas salmonicida TaxID=645 RepID=UPI001F269976|nr:nucleotidyl transferase AbiEii/AbiGii toxin family protein [Aeromonas salmonicida]MCE9936006.1 nucleotidyl transferase AbiEii/AbiGii toxin family protein [Aeromonas salmonicida]